MWISVHPCTPSLTRVSYGYRHPRCYESYRSNTICNNLCPRFRSGFALIRMWVSVHFVPFLLLGCHIPTNFDVAKKATALIPSVTTYIQDSDQNSTSGFTLRSERVSNVNMLQEIQENVETIKCRIQFRHSGHESLKSD